MDIVSSILTHHEFREKPPVLVDIGASGFLHTAWKKIAEYSVYIGFDADTRELDYLKKIKGKFREFHIINKIASEVDGSADFYLTRYPQCSSALKPDSTKLRLWSFSDLFQVEKTISVETVSLKGIIDSFSLEYIDWFKTDSQGTDLRLFKSLGSKIISNLIIAEFEPGIMDAYENEDKMHSVMSYMEKYPFWLSDLAIKGPQKISHQNLRKFFTRQEQKLFPHLHKHSAFWGEMSYINNFDQKEMLNKRNILLGWVFSTIKQQHGFALELAQIGKLNFGDPVFETLQNCSIRSVRQNYWKIPFCLSKAVIRRLFS